MKTEDVLLFIYVAGCILTCVSAWISVARGNSSDDIAGIVLLVCWMWPLYPVFALFDYPVFALFDWWETGTPPWKSGRL